MQLRRTAPVLVTLALGIATLSSGTTIAATDASELAPAPVVTVTTSEDDVVASTQTVTPGNVLFSVSGSGSAVLLQLRGSYTLKKLYADFDKVFSGRPGPARRMNRGATFYGGVFASMSDVPSQFGGDLAPGDYQLADLVSRRAVSFEVAGTPETRTAPSSAGTVRYTDHGIAMPRTMPVGGWMHLVNRSDEISLLDIVHVKPGTTRKAVRQHFASQGRKYANRFTATYDSTLLLSPAQEYWWSYGLSKGPAVTSSLWPRERDGEMQSFHGTWGMTQVR